MKRFKTRVFTNMKRFIFELRIGSGMRVDSEFSHGTERLGRFDIGERPYSAAGCGQ